MMALSAHLTLDGHLTESGRRIVERGGADHVSDDDMLLLEVAHRAPGMSRKDLESCFISLRCEYGDDAVRAIRSGHVKFERRASQ